MQKENSIIRAIQANSNRFFLAFDHGVSLASFDGGLLRDVEESIRANKAVVDEIEELNEADLDAFVKDTRVFIFESQSARGIDGVLYGLSSFDGSRAYIRRRHLDETDVTVPRRLLEHEFMHNISRWRKRDPRRTSPSKNAKLVIDGHMVEAGDFFEHRVYNEPVPNPSPFCLSEYKAKRY